MEMKILLKRKSFFLVITELLKEAPAMT